MALSGIIELTLPNGLAIRTHDLKVRHEPWVQKNVAEMIVERIRESLSSDAFETLYDWARTVPGFKPGEEDAILAFSVVAIASEQGKLPTLLLDEIASDPQCVYSMFFKRS